MKNKPSVDDALKVIHSYKDLPVDVVAVLKAYVMLVQVAELQANNLRNHAAALLMSADRLVES